MDVSAAYKMRLWAELIGNKLLLAVGSKDMLELEMKTRPFQAMVFLCWAFSVVSPGFSQGLTFTSNTYNVGGRPESVQAVDVNRDGKVDLVCANALDDTLSVLTNCGNGVFALASSPSVGRYPYSVAAADVNQDSKVDLICANAGGGSLSVMTNDGEGHFTLSSSPGVAGSTFSLTSADVNQDGKVNLICANGASGTMQVLTNDGSGGFALASVLNAGTYPSSVVAADVNGDGYVDLICAAADAVLSVTTNDGSGSFVLSSTPAVDYGPIAVVAADINGDGWSDLISASFNSISLSVVTNDGSGKFDFGCSLDAINHSTQSGCPHGITASDVNGDGHVDLICANLCAGELQVFTNTGTGGFTLATGLDVGGGPTSVAAGDVNEDGKPDLICVTGNNTLSVLINTSTFPEPTVIPKLTLTLQGKYLHVTWPAASPGWTLQQNPNLTAQNWTPSGYDGYSIADEGTVKSLILPSPKGNLFFRLSHP